MTDQTPTQAVTTLQQNSINLIQRLHETQIVDIESQKHVAENVIVAKSALDKINQVKQQYKKPINEQLKEIDEYFKPVIDAIAEAKNIGEQRLDEWRKSEKEKNENLLDTVGKDYIEKLREAKQTGEVVPFPRLPDLNQPKTLQTNAGGLTHIEKKTVVVINADKVPRDCCSPDKQKLQKRADSGVEYIEGCIIKKYFVLRRTGQKTQQSKEKLLQQE